MAPSPDLEKFSTEKKSKFFFFSSTQNGPIRKVNMLKSKFEDIFVHIPLLRSSWLDTQKIFRPKKNLKNNFFFHRLKMVQFAKLTCQNRNLKIFHPWPMMRSSWLDTQKIFRRNFYFYFFCFFQLDKFNKFDKCDELDRQIDRTVGYGGPYWKKENKKKKRKHTPT